MTVTTIPRPAPAAPDIGGDDDWVHGWCCDPDVALCGTDIAGLAEVHPTSSDDMCPTCRAAVEVGGPCSAPECPERTQP